MLGHRRNHLTFADFISKRVVADVSCREILCLDSRSGIPVQRQPMRSIKTRETLARAGMYCSIAIAGDLQPISRWQSIGVGISGVCLLFESLNSQRQVIAQFFPSAIHGE